MKRMIRSLFSPSSSSSSSATPSYFKIREILHNVYQVHFDKQSQLASTFLRFQEFYESPKFRGRTFTRAEFEEYYTQEHGSFSYLEDWAGFNLPSDVLHPFLNGDFDPLSDEEVSLLQYFRQKFSPVDGPLSLPVPAFAHVEAMKASSSRPGPEPEEPQGNGHSIDSSVSPPPAPAQSAQPPAFYVIGTHGRLGFIDPSTLKHELCHALFHLNQEYSRRVLEVLAQVDTAPLVAYLRGLGYHEHVLLDETNAYLVADRYWLLRKAGVEKETYREVISTLQGLYEEAAGKAEVK